MPQRYHIIRNSKMSVDRVDVERELSVDVNRTTSQLRGGDIKSTIDLNEQYLKERNSCTDYRLMLTIKPYCTNVLFNPLTEVVWGEGSESAYNISFYDRTDIINGEHIQVDKIHLDKKDIRGKTNVNTCDMIRNTEYSREGVSIKDANGNDIHFDYHPGVDIFNNHIIRNKSYRIVNASNKIYKSDVATDIFNTIADYMRDANGMRLKRCCRKSVDDVAMIEKHLYDKEDILPYYTGEAISENLKEQDGWFGFYNTSVISAKDENGNDMDISRVINNKGNCEFIDMYPDRSLFSFVPKYNPYRNRLEYNWEYAITYAFESAKTYKYVTIDEHEHQICKEAPFNIIQSGTDDNAVNGLFALNVEYRRLPNGAGAVFFRSAVKHNLKPLDSVYLYFNLDEKNGQWRKTSHTYIVDGVGDINHKNEEYYFYITNLDFLEEVFCTPYLCDISSSQADRSYTAWEYVRDYFYDEFYDTNKVLGSGDNITEFNDFSADDTYVPGQYIEKDGLIYRTKNKHSGPWDEGADFEPRDGHGYTKAGLVTHLGDNIVDYPFYGEKDERTGLTNIPTANDWFISVNGVVYILTNHDRHVVYDGSGDCDSFIQGIINNAFGYADKYTGNDNYKSGESYNYIENNVGVYQDYVSVRFVKTNGNLECNYYVRKFKKVPGSSGITLDNETYKLAFSNTIYGDSIVQSVFTDNINIAGLKDNLGRDLTEVFLTVVKTNKGHDKWYNGKVYNAEDIEYSHCFGNVTCGFEISNQIDDVIGIKAKRSELIDVTLINQYGNQFSEEVQEATGDENIPGFTTIPNCIDIDGFTTDDINIGNEWFYGDVVEFCPWTCEETPISDVCFRFNTAQRELNDSDNNAIGIIFDEISSDDYDKSFNICTYKVSQSINRKEGYYYKAHYRIPLRELSPVIQDCHPYLSVLTTVPIQMDGIYILVKTSLKHRLLDCTKVLLRDTRPEFATEWWLDVVSIIDDYTFIMQTISKDDENYQDWVTVCKCLNDKSYTLRAKNPNIPDNATKIGVNTYLWRDAVGVLDLDSDSEVSKYVFANGNVYVDNCFNFFLKRQDPYDTNKLYFDGSQSKIVGGEEVKTYCICNSDDSPSTNNSGNCEQMDAIDKWFIADTESKAMKRESNFEYNDQDYTAEC